MYYLDRVKRKTSKDLCEKSKRRLLFRNALYPDMRFEDFRLLAKFNAKSLFGKPDCRVIFIICNFRNVPGIFLEQFFYFLRAWFFILSKNSNRFTLIRISSLVKIEGETEKVFVRRGWRRPGSYFNRREFNIPKFTEIQFTTGHQEENVQSVRIWSAFGGKLRKGHSAARSWHSVVRCGRTQRCESNSTGSSSASNHNAWVLQGHPETLEGIHAYLSFR